MGLAGSYTEDRWLLPPPVPTLRAPRGADTEVPRWPDLAVLSVLHGGLAAHVVVLVVRAVRLLTNLG